MNDLKNKRKLVISDWQNAFPQLITYPGNKLFKVVGPVIIGLEMTTLPGGETYRPHFVVYSLWNNPITKKRMAGPILLSQYRNKKGLQFSISYEKHDVYLDEAVECVRKQTSISFDGNIALGKIISLFDNYSQQPPLSASPNSYLQASLQKNKMMTALYVSEVKAKMILGEIRKRKWDLAHFKLCKIDVNNWLLMLDTIVENRPAFLTDVEECRAESKIAKLNFSELIL